MFPPSQGINLDIEALSGICGSVSIACWVVVFSPQIVENFRRGSTEGLSLLFIIVWLAGDVFNILGAVLQGVLPTMIILAVYYTLADIVLLAQCFYYRGWRLGGGRPSSPSPPPSLSEAAPSTAPTNGISGPSAGTPDETSALLYDNAHRRTSGPTPSQSHSRTRRPSLSHLTNVDGTHLSPVTPLLDPPKPTDPPATRNIQPASTFQTIVSNTFVIVMVCAAGVFGWWVSNARSRGRNDMPDDDSSVSDPNDALSFSILGQVFGYFCAALYLGSRIPQILLNYRRKSTEGVSMLFFLFACIGNLTYVLSIFAYSPRCYKFHKATGPAGVGSIGGSIGGFVGGSVGGQAGAQDTTGLGGLSNHPLTDQGYFAPRRCHDGEAAAIYARYMLVNLSWLLGSFGTLVLDMCIFVQFFMYRKPDDSDDEWSVGGSSEEEDSERGRRVAASG
ncbi:PQ-loop-domain-containing protein [Xylona heveae TC161]|uniref:PQ-loop-domain-containing protein n=1 Tax=Xylona heveae (strain CBS 132557 / TC161) TaxID=1328760 RepID=A0A165ACJ7_XYLHT|nr:PQ-loop-domain-containing protein [Xylona heveae TC161]KZF20254.1 PQ-loop-domain-containing protein [Xylona heveae TC161]